MMFGYFAANVALLSGPHATSVIVPFWPTSLSRKAYMHRRPSTVGGLIPVTYVLIFVPFSGSGTPLY